MTLSLGVLYLVIVIMAIHTRVFSVRIFAFILSQILFVSFLLLSSALIAACVYLLFAVWAVVGALKLAHDQAIVHQVAKIKIWSTLGGILTFLMSGLLVVVMVYKNYVPENLTPQSYQFRIQLSQTVATLFDEHSITLGIVSIIFLVVLFSLGRSSFQDRFEEVVEQDD
ncbi:hypothetical protein JW979_07735 [bacterium]|nr:hypothetical protein [candidate division CSSED10-310 bacterium]